MVCLTTRIRTRTRTRTRTRDGGTLGGVQLAMLEEKGGGGEAAESAAAAPPPARKRDPSALALSALVVGQSYPGVVKSVKKIGAFIDIGAERDGFCHVRYAFGSIILRDWDLNITRGN